jgi:hypothetical protein
MLDVVRSAIDRAKAARAEKTRQLEAEAAQEAADIKIVERHSNFANRLSEAKNDFRSLSAILKERYGGEFLPMVAMQLATDSRRLEGLAVELAGAEAMKRNLPELLEEFYKCTVGAAERDLREFEKENHAVLKAYKAI